MRRELRGVYAADAGALIELVYASCIGSMLLNAMLDQEVELVTHELAVTELHYILCRQLGEREAKARVEKLLSSGYLVVEDLSGLLETAANYKCKRSISLPDCFTLSLGKERSLPVLFARKEKELLAENDKEAFNVDIHYLEDYVDLEPKNE